MTDIAGLPKGLHSHGVGQIDAREIHQAECSHGMPGAVNLSLVDVFHAGHAHLQQPEGLAGDSAEYAVKQETVDFFFEVDGTFSSFSQSAMEISRVSSDTWGP